jgi:hypothetical protein
MTDQASLQPCSKANQNATPANRCETRPRAKSKTARASLQHCPTAHHSGRAQARRGSRPRRKTQKIKKCRMVLDPKNAHPTRLAARTGTLNDSATWRSTGVWRRAGRFRPPWQGRRARPNAGRQIRRTDTPFIGFHQFRKHCGFHPACGPTRKRELQNGPRSQERTPRSSEFIIFDNSAAPCVKTKKCNMVLV